MAGPDRRLPRRRFERQKATEANGFASMSLWTLMSNAPCGDVRADNRTKHTVRSAIGGKAAASAISAVKYVLIFSILQL
jgi:hypothetical protein